MVLKVGQGASDHKKKLGVSEKDRKEALHYMTTLVDVARESFLILDAKLTVLQVNPIFLKTFKVKSSETLHKRLYELGNGQWDIAELKKLLEEILPKKKVVRDYEVYHKFEDIGNKTMSLNARQIDSVQLIILAIEDNTTQKRLEKSLARNAKSLEIKVKERTSDITEKVKRLEALNKIMVGRELKMVELKKEIAILKKNKI